MQTSLYHQYSLETTVVDVPINPFTAKSKERLLLCSFDPVQHCIWLVKLTFQPAFPLKIIYNDMCSLQQNKTEVKIKKYLFHN